MSRPQNNLSLTLNLKIENFFAPKAKKKLPLNQIKLKARIEFSGIPYAESELGSLVGDRIDVKNTTSDTEKSRVKVDQSGPNNIDCIYEHKSEKAELDPACQLSYNSENSCIDVGHLNFKNDSSVDNGSDVMGDYKTKQTIDGVIGGQRKSRVEVEINKIENCDNKVVNETIDSDDFGGKYFELEPKILFPNCKNIRGSESVHLDPGNVSNSNYDRSNNPLKLEPISKWYSTMGKRKPQI